MNITIGDIAGAVLFFGGLFGAAYLALYLLGAL